MSEIAGVVITKEIAKNLAETFDKLNRFVTEESANLDSHLTSIDDFVLAFNPLAPAMTNVFNQIKEATLEETMLLMKEAFELANNPIVSGGITLLSTIISKIFDTISDGLNDVNDGISAIHTTGEIIRSFKNDPANTIKDLFNVLKNIGK